MVREHVVIADAELGEGETAKFAFDEGDDRREGFVIRHQGRVLAYRNECRHIPMTLDWVENRFLARDGCFIQCATHGALYEIASGLCIEGPPAGEHLRTLEVEVREDQIVVKLPE
jgi:nitrite reductase/ring-hydroxylating ferredoxin subunit